ncbi:hypothetical protein ACWCPQ_32970 [Nocardia sp. NPDC001965]
MVGSRHEAMHRIFQHDPGVFARAFHKLKLPFATPEQVELLPTDLTEIRPIERRVDTLLRVTTGEGPFLLIVEAQTGKDPQKPDAWAYYATYLRIVYRLPVYLLVVCRDEAVAQWARSPIPNGAPRWPTVTVKPLVLGPGNVPVITDPAEAADDIPLTALSAITHASDPRINAILKALATALRGEDADDLAIFGELTELGLGDTPAADIWRRLMTVDLSFFRSQTAERLRSEGRTEGIAEGRTEGRTEGIAGSIVRVLTRRGLTVDTDVRQRIEACAEIETLQLWLDRAVVVDSVDQLFD